MYQLNPEAAKQADQKGGSINDTGKYAGIFTRAENVRSPRGTVGVEFSFRSDDGRNADYLTLWTKNADGKELYGFKILMAVMACLKVRSIAPVMQTVEKYDHDSGQKHPVQVEVFPELMNKPIGLLIQMEEYVKSNGTTAWKPSIYAPFAKDGEFTASEVLSKATKAETVTKMLATLRDKPLRNKPAAAPSAHDHGPAPTCYADFDDSIPF